MADEMEELKDRLLDLIEKKQFNEVRTIASEMNEVDIAALFEELEGEQLMIVYRLLPKGLAAQAFAYMEPDTQKKLIAVFTDKELAFVMDELYIDDAADLIDEMPANVVKRILRMTTPDDRKTINQILKYPDDSAGSVLTTEYVDLKASQTVAQAFQSIRRSGPDKETIYTCYVTDDTRHLQGVVSVKELLLAKEDTAVGDLMETNVISVKTADDQEEAATLCAKYDLIAVPVVDSEERLVGIITVDDVVDIMQEEATEDIEKMAAIVPTDKSYFRTGIFETFSKRIPWLMLLMVSATFTGMIISSFESALKTYVALTAFIPMLMDTGGNSGSQASVTVIRALALGDVDFPDLLRVVWKEIRVALLCGVALSSVNFLKMLLVDRRLLQNSSVTVAVCLTVCLTRCITVFFAKLVGCVLPLFAKKIGFDPAVMASPFITTIVDAISLLVYFQVATTILGL